jgi:hypothetical protein
MNTEKKIIYAVLSAGIFIFSGCAQQKKVIVVESLDEERVATQDSNEVVATQGVVQESNENKNPQISETQEPGEIEFDRIEAVIEDSSGIEKIRTSDVKSRGFDGVQHSLDEVIDEHLMASYGKEKLKIEARDEDVNRYLMQMSNGAPISQEYLASIARMHGYTLQEFYDEMKRLYESNGLIEYEVHAHLDISDEAVKEYHEKNPVIEEAVYYIQSCFVPNDDSLSRDEQEDLLGKQEYRAKKSLQWTVPLDIKTSSVDKDKPFILTMSVGDVVVVAEKEGFMLYKLHDKVAEHPASIDKRKEEIAMELRKQKFMRLLEDLKKRLRTRSKISYLR